MSVAQPVGLGRTAWAALRDGLLEPARATAAPEAMVPLARLSAAWAAPLEEGDRVTVFLTPEDAATLAALLDGHPELAALLG
ncbi:MAG: hypothetical protein JWO90_116 [Solirubrobacterales bacterium]|nr:hypothetical protein [Solirubrobacterales bacterium]